MWRLPCVDRIHGLFAVWGVTTDSATGGQAKGAEKLEGGERIEASFASAANAWEGYSQGASRLAPRRMLLDDCFFH
jgi:hypothetical protein